MIEVGQSELKDLRQCPLKHRFRWVLGWHIPEGHVESNQKSQIGTQWHAIAAAHYRAKRETEASDERYTVEQARVVMGRAVNDICEVYGSDEERRALLTWMADGYLERWGTDPDWEILAVERRLSVPIVDPDNPRAKPEFAIRFTADLVVRLRSIGRKVIVDNKTVEGQGWWAKMEIDIDDQLGLYTRGLARLEPDDPPILAMLNQVRRDRLKRPMLLTERFARPRSNRTRRELDEIERDALADLRRMHSAENRRRPSSSPNPRQCGWSCEFKESHVALRRSGGDWSHAIEILHARGFSNDPGTDPALTDR